MISFDNFFSESSILLIRTENQAAIKMAEDDATGNTTKHIDTKDNILRDYVCSDMIDVEYFPTAAATADVQMKSLQRISLGRFPNHCALNQVD